MCLSNVKICKILGCCCHFARGVSLNAMMIFLRVWYAWRWCFNYFCYFLGRKLPWRLVGEVRGCGGFCKLVISMQSLRVAMSNFSLHWPGRWVWPHPSCGHVEWSQQPLQ